MTISKSNKREKKRRKAKEANKLGKPLTDEKRQQGRVLIIFFVSFVIIAAGLVLYLQH